MDGVDDLVRRVLTTYRGRGGDRRLFARGIALLGGGDARPDLVIDDLGLQVSSPRERGASRVLVCDVLGEQDALMTTVWCWALPRWVATSAMVVSSDFFSRS